MDERRHDYLHEHRITALEKAMVDVSVAIKSIDAALHKFGVIQLEQQHVRQDVNRAFEELREVRANLSDIDEKVNDIAEQLPTLNLIKGWVIGGILAIVSSSFILKIFFAG